MKLYLFSAAPVVRAAAAARSMRHYHAVVDAVRAVMVTAAAVALGLALVAWLTPCEAGALCTTLPAATRPNFWRRQWLYLQRWYMRAQLQAVDVDLLILGHDLATLPARIEHMSTHAEALRVRITDVELELRHG